MIHDVAEWLSLFLTVPTLVLSAVVVHYWRNSAVAAFYRSNKSAMDWFVLGVAIGFAGTFADNFYWGAAWAASYLDLQVKHYLFDWGVYSNIPCRQIAGLLSAYCHVRSAMAHAREVDDYSAPKVLDFIMNLSFLCGLLVALALLLFKVS